MNAEQKHAAACLFNILIALADHTGMEDVAVKEIFHAAKVFGLSSEDLLRAVLTSGVEGGVLQ